MWGEAPFLGKFIEEENSYEEMTLQATGKGTGRLNAVITVNMGASPDTLASFLTKTKDRLDCGVHGLAPTPLASPGPSTRSAEPAGSPSLLLSSQPVLHPSSYSQLIQCKGFLCPMPEYLAFSLGRSLPGTLQRLHFNHRCSLGCSEPQKNREMVRDERALHFPLCYLLLRQLKL